MNRERILSPQAPRPGRRPFAAGDRVICKPNGCLGPDMVGYYGHVATIRPAGIGSAHQGQNMVLVSLIGRVGGPVNENNLDKGDDPWIFYEDELEHAD